MTRTLILMRHAKSSWDHPALMDHDRPLNMRGKASALAMGDWLRRKGYVPEAAVSSTSERTGQTFLGLSFDVPVRFSRVLYHARAETMMAVLKEQTEQTVLMLGHNPGIAEFAEQLVEQPPEHMRFLDYPTCATTIIRFDMDSWTEVDWGVGQVVDFAVPREVMAG
ncbi:phosphoglycerate mutase [Tateyamaria omphalii]|uniref:SixA phosphatase family protein n=1 Tax=Tateyamaria omphalii TaxID=299262 RepID=UPI001671DB0E|nr:histidine phosphatase family protein [Tateyamaria omphalii]GGX68713.1 phosphoglycerate mutase [Tateyamaria omphalii]